MQRQLTFVPIGRDEAIELAAGHPLDLPRPGFAATSELYEALDYSSEQDEEAEHAAMVLASVYALSAFGERLVLVADLPATALGSGDTAEIDNGSVTVRQCPASAILAWYADAPDAPIAGAARTAHGLSIDEAWDDPDVQLLLAQHELLWHGADELGTLG